MARASLVVYINPLEARVEHVRIQVDAHQIINWCAPINYFHYLVRAKSFRAHQLIT